MDICNVTKLPCAYCNPVCEHRVKPCLCEDEDADDIRIVKNEQGFYELQFWDWRDYDDDGYSDCDYVCVNRIMINFCPKCGRDLMS